MSIPWSDHFGHRLELTRDPDCAGSVACVGKDCAGGCVVFGDGDFYLPAGRLAEFCATVYQAAGLPAPLILDRPEPRDLLVPGPGDGRSWVEVEHSPAARTGRGLTVPGGPGVSLAINRGGGDTAEIRLIGDEPLRVAVALADAVRPPQDEPDPAEVEELTGALVQAGAGLRSTGVGDIALAALRWMKQQRGERRDG